MVLILTAIIIVMQFVFCPNCGQKAPSAASKFCGSCGQSLFSMEKKAPQKTIRAQEEFEDDEYASGTTEIPDLDTIKESIARANKSEPLGPFDTDFGKMGSASISFGPNGMTNVPFRRKDR